MRYKTLVPVLVLVAAGAGCATMYHVRDKALGVARDAIGLYHRAFRLWYVAKMAEATGADEVERLDAIEHEFSKLTEYVLTEIAALDSGVISDADQALDRLRDLISLFDRFFDRYGINVPQLPDLLTG